MVISLLFFYAVVHDFYKSIFFFNAQNLGNAKATNVHDRSNSVFLSTRHWLEFVISVLAIKDFDLMLTTKTARSNAWI